MPLNVDPAARLRALALAGLSLQYLRPQRHATAAIRRAREAARNSTQLGRLSTLVAPRRVRAAGPLDGIVQIGTGYLLPDDGTPIATLEDMTVAQVRSQPYLGWDLYDDRAYRVRLDLQSRAYEQAHAVCLTSRWAAASVVQDYGIEPSKVHIVGVGQNRTAPPPSERDWATPRFLFVGLDWERKNGPTVLRVFARLRAEFPDALLDVVGGHPVLDEPGVTGHGVLRLNEPAQQARADELFSQATCFVMPSLSEAAGIAYVEAAAAGLPCIGTTAGGSEYLIGEGGLLVDPHDEGALLVAMRTLADPATAARTGGEAWRRSQLFTWAHVGRRLLRALDGEDVEGDQLA